MYLCVHSWRMLCLFRFHSKQYSIYPSQNHFQFLDNFRKTYLLAYFWIYFIFWIFKLTSKFITCTYKRHNIYKYYHMTRVAFCIRTRFTNVIISRETRSALISILSNFIFSMKARRAYLRRVFRLALDLIIILSILETSLQLQNPLCPHKHEKLLVPFSILIIWPLWQISTQFWHIPWLSFGQIWKIYTLIAQVIQEAYTCSQGLFL